MERNLNGESKRKGSTTSKFGSSRRENHDSKPFYSRFQKPNLVSDAEIVYKPEIFNRLIHGDSRNMDDLPDRSVAMVITSPPYFAGKEYELDPEDAASSYEDYLKMLEEVFKECHRVLEPGGRIAVNVANLGRKPFRSLATDVTKILSEKIGFLLRGEIIWIKGKGANGSCAWGTFGKSTNPVLRDVTERIIVASKGRFDRALTVPQRKMLGLPYESTITKEEFMSLTIDLWEIQPESAKKIGHPAPFPIELPMRLIKLYTYKNDLILDPFLGSGSTAIAAKLCDRNYVGYEKNKGYLELAVSRLKERR